MRIDELTKPQRLAAGCMLVVAIAAFLPWVSLFGIGLVGIKGDGRITLLCAIVGLAVLAFETRKTEAPRRSLRIVGYVAAGLAALVGLGDMNGAAALGLYLTLFGSIGWIAALVWDGVERKKAISLDGSPEQSGS